MRVLVRADDMFVTGETDDGHLQNLEEVLTRLEKAGLRATLGKCRFFLNQKFSVWGR